MPGVMTWERVALLLGTGAALGVGLPLARLAGAAGVGPLSFALLPAGGAALLLTLLAWRQQGWPARAGRLLGFGAVVGLLGNALPNSLGAWLAHSAGAGFTGLAYTLPPVFTLALLLLLRWERWQAARVLAVGLGLAGAVWLVAARVGGGELSPGAALLLLALPLALAAGNVYRARYLPAGVGPLWLGAAAALGGFAWLLPAWWLAPEAFSAFSPAGLRYVALQVLAAALGLLLFFRLQLRSEPVTLSFVGYAIALMAVLSSAALLGERLPLQLLPAGLLIAAGFWLIQRQPAAREARP